MASNPRKRLKTDEESEIAFVEPTTEAICSHDPTKKVNICFQNGDSEAFDFLIVAADPQDGLTSKILKKTTEEEVAFSKTNMQSFTFQTTLMKFPKAATTLPTVRFNPANMNTTAGSLYGYRSETRKEANYLAVQNNPPDLDAEFSRIFDTVEYEYVTCYQLLDPTKHGTMDESEMQEKLDKEMAEGLYKAWFPYSWTKGTRVNRFHTKYFNHFAIESLVSPNLPDCWSIYTLQGENNTIYVHASTAFESVLHIYNYIRMLWDSKRRAFPLDKKSQIAIIGAGPSGLLIARKLSREGYSNMKIFEVKPNNDDPDSKMFAGKTQTNVILGQLNADIPAELGTCYLSPAYDHMVADFKSSGLLVAQDQVSFDQAPGGPVLREIVTAGQFHPEGPIITLMTHDPTIVNFLSMPPTMNFNDYALLKGFEEQYADSGLSAEALVARFKNFKFDVAIAVVKYIGLHVLYFGGDRPFPQRRNFILNQLLGVKIPEFLAKNDLKCLTGTLQYGYSVQGYGSTAMDSTMSAFYLMVWITPSIFIASLGNQLKALIKDLVKNQMKSKFQKHWFDEDKAIVTAWTKGWGDVWRQLKEQFDEEGSGVSIQYNADIATIVRN